MSMMPSDSASPEQRRQPKLLDRMKAQIRLKHYSKRTEEAYIMWARRFILFHHKRHPQEMGVLEIEQFLSHLAVVDHVAASTQNQALYALLFLYKQVLKIDLKHIDAIRARTPTKLPVVFSRQEITRIMAHLDGVHWLMAYLLYGSGMRLMECIRLRVKDVDFEYTQLVIRDGKGEKDRITMLPQLLEEPLRQQIVKTQMLHEQDIREGYGDVYLPYALARKYPNASKELGWKFVFPSHKRSRDPRSGNTMRHHKLERVPEVRSIWLVR